MVADAAAPFNLNDTSPGTSFRPSCQSLGCSTNLVSFGAQELDLLQVMVPPPLGLRADYCKTSNQHTGKTHHKKSKAREIPSNLTSRSSPRWIASASRSSDSSKAL